MNNRQLLWTRKYNNNHFIIVSRAYFQHGDCHATDAQRAISVWKLNMKTKWVCIQLACSWRPRVFEEAHHQNIQAKFYNEKFPLVYESDNIGDSLYEEHGATLKHKCGKRIVTFPLLSFYLIFCFHFLSFFSLFLGSFWSLFFRPESHPDLWVNYGLNHPFLTGTML